MLDFLNSTGEKNLPIYKRCEKIEEFSPMHRVYGIVKECIKKNNSFTGTDYYHIIIENDNMTFNVFAGKDQVIDDIYKGMIILAECYCTAIFSRREGTSHFFTFNIDVNKEDCSTKLFDTIVSLDDLMDEFLVLSFEEADRVDNINFIQTANCGAKYVLEIGKIINGKRRLFRYAECELHTVLAIFNDLCVKGQAPDLSGWEDVSYIIKVDQEEA